MHKYYSKYNFIWQIKPTHVSANDGSRQQADHKNVKEMFRAAGGEKYQTTVGTVTVYGQYIHIIWQLHTVLLRVIMRYDIMEGVRCSAVEL
jgi:hypothetical protein